MRNILMFFLVGFVVFGLFSFGVSGFEGITYFPENNSYANCTVLEAINYSGVVVASSVIYLDDTGFGRGIAEFNVQNHSRIVSVQVVSDIVISGANISVGKDGQYKDGDYTEFGECVNFGLGISPDWNQTLEMYIRSEELISFELWATVVPGIVWRNGGWEVDNPEQVNQLVLVADIVGGIDIMEVEEGLER